MTDARIGVLSLGQRRRLVLALSELGRPRVRLLDEPTVGLDDAGQRSLIERLRAHANEGGAVLIASHEETLADMLGATVRRLDRSAGR
jgi:ABC-2 type transport system ATP-binding protein